MGMIKRGKTIEEIFRKRSTAQGCEQEDAEGLKMRKQLLAGKRRMWLRSTVRRL